MAASALGTTRSLLLLVILLIAAAVGEPSSSSLLPLAATTTVNAAANGRGVTLRIDRRQVRRPLAPCRVANHRIYLLSIYALGFLF